MQTKICLPPDGRWILERLRQNGFAAYAVGGCVRDALLGRTPHDWDFCTAATPEQILQCFSDVPCLTIGQQHGTIGILRNGTVYELTTFRQESTYRDHRHPDAVAFTDSLTADLQRRDFTINAMAYHPETGIVDPFHGAKDLQRQVIRCVGNPIERFQEDALRILRGIRFAATYGFSIVPATAAAMQEAVHCLQWVSAERILSECDRLVTAPYGAEVLWRHRTIWFSLFPTWQPAENSWQHTLQRLKRCQSEDSILCWAALLYDKTASARQICKQLKMEKKKTAAIVALVQQDTPISPERLSLLRLLQTMGEPQTRRLLQLQDANQQMKQLLEQILQEQPCLHIRDLTICGKDLLALGMPQGKAVGDLLGAALEQVICGALPNQRDVLLQWVQQSITSTV